MQSRNGVTLRGLKNPRSQAVYGLELSRMFHRAGSDLVASGIPFTHAIRRNVKGDWEDTSNDDAPTRFGPGSIGIGGCRNSVPSKTTVSEARAVGAETPLGRRPRLAGP